MSVRKLYCLLQYKGDTLRFSVSTSDMLKIAPEDYIDRELRGVKKLSGDKVAKFVAGCHEEALERGYNWLSYRGK